MMKIRPYTPIDLEMLCSIFMKSVPEYFDASELDDFKNFIKKESCPYCILEVDGGVAGAFGYAMDDETTGAIVWIFFDPDVQTRGLGRAAVQHCHEQLEVLGATRVRSMTSQKTEGFFAKMGYDVVRRESDYWGAGLDLVEMMRSIG